MDLFGNLGATLHTTLAEAAASGPDHRRRPVTALLTDLYQLTMACALVVEGRAETTATFSLFVRSLPPSRGFLVAAGLDDVLRYLADLRFCGDDLTALRGLDLGGGAHFPAGFLDWLEQARFTGTVRAIPEGRIAFANEPLVEVTGPLGVVQIAETYLLNQVGLQTTLATKAARYRHAAGDRSLVDFALRRAHGTDAGMKVARCSAIAGFAATSNVAAALRYGLATSGTMAHSYVLAHEGELDAFRAFAAGGPGPVVLLVDTYDSDRGIARAVELALELQRSGERPHLDASGPAAPVLAGIRLDSGDLPALAFQARAALDAVGLTDVAVLASGGLDEQTVAALVAGRTPIDGFGIGTRLGVSDDAPVLEIVYKLVEAGGRPVAKRSPGKATLPGPKGVWRRSGFGGDTITCASEQAPASGAEPILGPVAGPAPSPSAAVQAARAAFEQDWAQLPIEYKNLTNPSPYPVAVSRQLGRLAQATQTFTGSTEESPTPT